MVADPGSVAVTWNGTASPKLNTRPLGGWVSVTVACPTPMTVLAVALPQLLVAVSVAVNWPLAV